MGVDDSVDVHLHEIPVYKKDILVISSDGLSDKASPEEILRVVVRTNSDRACQELVDLANERGGDDNVTTIVLKVKNVKNAHGGFGAVLTNLLRKMKLKN